MEAYIYAYPLVTMETTREMMKNMRTPQDHQAVMGQFYHSRTFNAFAECLDFALWERVSHALQDQYKLISLSAFGKPYPFGALLRWIFRSLYSA